MAAWRAIIRSSWLQGELWLIGGRISSSARTGGVDLRHGERKVAAGPFVNGYVQASPRRLGEPRVRGGRRGVRQRHAHAHSVEASPRERFGRDTDCRWGSMVGARSRQCVLYVGGSPSRASPRAYPRPGLSLGAVSRQPWIRASAEAPSSLAAAAAGHRGRPNPSRTLSACRSLRASQARRRGGSHAAAAEKHHGCRRDARLQCGGKRGSVAALRTAPLDQLRIRARHELHSASVRTSMRARRAPGAVATLLGRDGPRVGRPIALAAPGAPQDLRNVFAHQ